MDAAGIIEVKKSLASAVAANRVEDVRRLLLRLRQEVAATEDLLKETKIGLTVGKLRSNPSKPVADLAKDIVQKWKKDVGPARVGKTGSSGGPSGSKDSSLNSPAPDGVKPQLSNQVDSSANTPSASPLPNAASQPRTSVKTEPVKQEPPSSASIKQEAPSAASTTSANSPPSSLPDKPRSAASDGQAFELHQDKTRDTCMKLIYDALVYDSVAPADLVFNRSRAIEDAVIKANNNEAGAGYRTKMRSLYTNLKDKNNPSLRASIISGELLAEKLIDMSPADFASEETKARDLKLMEDNLFKARGAANVQSETDTFKCGRCKQKKCTYYQLQTRSADEPLTTFVTCTVCQNRWKFS